MPTSTSGIRSPTTTRGCGTSRPSRFVTETIARSAAATCRPTTAPMPRRSASTRRCTSRPNGIPRDPVGEMRYVEELRREYGLPTVAVAQARLDQPDAAKVLAQQAAFAFVRSVRHKPRANRSPAESSPGGMTDAQWRNGYAELGAQRPALRLADAVVASRRGDAARRPIFRTRRSSSITRACRRIAAPKALPAGSARWERWRRVRTSR